MSFLLLIVLWVGSFFLMSAIVYGLWNTSVQSAFGDNIIQDISYVNAMGLTFFLLIVFRPPASVEMVNVYQSYIMEENQSYIKKSKHR